MARLSKASVVEDGETAPAIEYSNGMDATVATVADLSTHEALLEDHLDYYNHAGDADDERRESAMTTTSISSFPESAIMSDTDPLTPILNLYAPHPAHSNFRWPGASAHAERLSLSPLGSRSPRRVKLGHRSRAGTPKSLGNIDFRGSPRYRRRISELTEAQPEIDEKRYPLVLLHVTLLPIRLPWSNDAMARLLPTDVLENIRQLRAKASETILSRGILVSHPQEEYDLLEERLLEALELQDERLTKCGHVRTRSSISSASDSDSGLGSSIDGSDNELCAICQHHIRPSRAPVCSGTKKWSIQVFAANGLLRPSAWAAAWSDMEAVDVEILPWIDDDLRRQLDESWVEEEAERQRRQRENEAEQGSRMQAEEIENPLLNKVGDGEGTETLPSNFEEISPTKTEYLDEIPDIYRPSQIPLSTLLWNYIYLLSQDWRNVAIAALSIIAILLLLQPLRSSADLYSLRIDSLSENVLPMPLQSDMQSGVDFVSQELEASASGTSDSVASFGEPPLEMIMKEEKRQVWEEDQCSIISSLDLFSLDLAEDTCLAEWR